jgi:predicted 3-demethylubiquinone-9 3-methyltransferase (glyoxalase superfamily)
MTVLKGKPMPKFSTCLWFDHQAEEAAKFYTSIFKNSKIGRVSRYGKEGYEIHGQPEGKVMTVEFELDGRPFLALNGGPQFQFNEAVSIIVQCDSQKEIDFFWEKLAQGGDPKAQACGWLKDKFGLSWQIVPSIISEMITDKDPEKTDRVMAALLPMQKIDLAALQKAFTRR